MGQQLLQYYEQAQQIGSLAAKMRLAMLTSVSSTQAADLPDSPELLTKFNNAIAQIRNEKK